MRNRANALEAQAVQDLQEAGYTFIERQKGTSRGSSEQARPSFPRVDLLAWGASTDGEFRPQASVELKSGNYVPQGVLATLSANAAWFGTRVNLLYNGEEWFESDPGFIQLNPIPSPPECLHSEGILRDERTLHQLLAAQTWRRADSLRGQGPSPFEDALIEQLNEWTRDSEGMIHGIYPGVIAPGDSAVRTLLEVFTSRNNKTREHVTPVSVCDVITSLAGLREGEALFDPFAGWGGLLLSVARGEIPSLARLSGNELDPGAHAIATKLLSLSGVDATLELTDSAATPWPMTDVLISVPPFGLSLQEAVDLPFGRVRELDIVAIAWAAQSLTPGGRAVLLTPRGWTFRSGASAKLRSWLRSNFHVSALIGLRAVTGGTSIPQMLMVIDNNEPADTVVADLTGDWQSQLAPGTELFRLMERRA